MRSRPALKVYISPSPARPGDTLQVSAVLVSRSETPVNEVRLSLRCLELTSIPQGKSAATFREEHFALVARHHATALTPGEHRFGVTFPVPYTAPATYESACTRVSCELEVRVVIPWWPDRVGRYAIDVAPLPVMGVARSPGLFATERVGPQGKQLYAECSLDSTLLEPGGIVRGSVSFANVSSSRITRVTAALTQHEVQHGDAYRRTWTPGRYEFVLREGAIVEGEAIPFGLALPRDLPVTRRAPLFEVAWTLEVAVEGTWRSRTLLAIPVTLLPLRSLPIDDQPALPPAVGRTRRRQVWAPAAAQEGLSYDPAADVIRGSAGAVSLLIAVEQRLRDGLFTAATLRWRPLGLALSVGPSHWNDRFSDREIDVGDPPFDARFRVRGRFPTQVRALLGAAVRQRLPTDGEVRIDDEGAQVSVPGALSDPSAIEAFVRAAAQLARALDGALTALPAPPPMLAYADAWRAFAERTRGRWEPGPCAVTDARVGVDRVDVACAWTDQGDLVATTITLRLDPPLGAAPAPAQIDEARSAARALRPDAEVSVSPDALRCSLPGTVEEPASLEPLIELMARVGRKLQGRSEVAPYR